MDSLFDLPLVFAAAVLALLWASARAGVFVRRRWRSLGDDEREDFGVIRSATLALLGLIVGFSFSMALTRYDQRKVLEEAEANAIGTAHARADLLPAQAGADLKRLLKAYIEQRVLFYTAREQQRLAEVAAHTARLQSELWAAVLPSAAAQPTPITALAVASVNDVLNAEGYTLAAWRNRLPATAWALMICIAACGNFLVGYGTHRSRGPLLLILPFTAGLAIFLIADMDSPRAGIIRVAPQNMLGLAASLR